MGGTVVTDGWSRLDSTECYPGRVLTLQSANKPEIPDRQKARQSQLTSGPQAPQLVVSLVPPETLGLWLLSRLLLLRISVSALYR